MREYRRAARSLVKKEGDLCSSCIPLIWASFALSAAAARVDAGGSSAAKENEACPFAEAASEVASRATVSFFPPPPGGSRHAHRQLLRVPQAGKECRKDIAQRTRLSSQ